MSFFFRSRRFARSPVSSRSAERKSRGRRNHPVSRRSPSSFSRPRFIDRRRLGDAPSPMTRLERADGDGFDAFLSRVKKMLRAMAAITKKEKFISLVFQSKLTSNDGVCDRARRRRGHHVRGSWRRGSGAGAVCRQQAAEDSLLLPVHRVQFFFLFFIEEASKQAQTRARFQCWCCRERAPVL